MDAGNGPRVERSPSKEVVQVLALWATAIGALWAMNAVPGFTPWQTEALGGPFLTTGLAFIVLPIFWGRFFGHDVAVIPSHTDHWKKALKTAARSLAILGPMSAVAFPLLGLLGTTPYELSGGVLLAAAHGVGLVLIVIVTRFVLFLPGDGARPAAIPLLVLATLIATVAALTDDAYPLVADLLYVFFFVGFGEELFFRGVIQERLNGVLNHSWTLLGAQIGAGMILAAVLFGISHFLSPSLPGRLGWALWTVAAGMVFGLIRDRGGSFVASGLVHGTLLVFPVLFGGLP